VSQRRCKAKVYYRDVLRYSGRGHSGFERDWRHRQCKRLAVEQELCAQHLHIEVLCGRLKRKPRP
jgi:hypothetical protein